MSHEDFMRRAIDIARQSITDDGSLPFGAVIVRNDRIIAEGLNRAPAKCDPTSHGEVEAIRAACEKLSTLDLSGCDLYTSCEPCAMCTSVMYMVGIRKVFYAGTMADSKAMYEQLARSDSKWQRRFDPLDVRQNASLAIELRSMPSEQLIQAESQIVFREFLKSRTTT